MKIALSILALLTAGLAALAQAPTPGWAFSAQVNQGYSNNVTGELNRSEADATTSLILNLGRSWSTPRSTFSLSYTPEAMNYLRHTELDYIAQAFEQSWEYNATPHTNLTWTSSLQRFPERAGAPQMGVPSLTGIQGASQAQQSGAVLTAGSTSLGFEHQSSLRTTWSAQWAGSWMGFQQDGALPADAAVGASSQTRSISGLLGWNYRLTAARSVGLTLNETEMWYPQLRQHRRNASVQATVSQQWGGTNISLGAGPAWNWVVGGTGTVGGPPSRSVAANADLSQPIGQARLGLNWSHAVQTSLTPGSLSTDSLALQLRQSFGKWSTGFSLGNTRMSSVVVKGPSRSGLFAAAQLNYAMTHWDWMANCTYFSQDMAAGPGPLAAVNRLQGSLGVSYVWQGAR